MFPVLPSLPFPPDTAKDFFPSRGEKGIQDYDSALSLASKLLEVPHTQGEEILVWGQIAYLEPLITENPSISGSFLSTKEASMRDPAEIMIVTQFVAHPLIHVHLRLHTTSSQKPSGSVHRMHHILLHHQ